MPDRYQQKACLGNDAKYPLCLGYGALAVQELLGQVEPSLILGRADTLGVAVGFDSGDFVLIGVLTDDGLAPIDLDAEVPEVPIAPILDWLRSSDSKRVFQAIFEVQRLGDRAPVAVPKLVRIAGTFEEFGPRQAAVKMLGTIAPNDPDAKTVVLQALDDVSPSVKMEALQAFISMSGLPEIDLVRIKGMESDPDEDVARWSEIALRNVRLREDAAEPGA